MLFLVLISHGYAKDEICLRIKTLIAQILIFASTRGTLIINYTWGNQMGIDFVGEARRRGTEA